MDAQIAKRLAMALAAKGINMKQAGLAAGLSSNYVRDVLRRGRGKFELLERVAEANGLSWSWLRTGEGEMFRKVGVKHTAAPPYYREQLELARLPSPEPATEEPVNILVNRAALLHALQMFGASEEQAVLAVEFLSALARAHKTNLP
jgi:transcriptional regulator with XRE-family HTH domain